MTDAATPRQYPLEIRYNFSGNLVAVFATLAIAGILAFYLIYAAILGKFGERWFFGLAACGAFLTLGVYHGRHMFDNRAVLTFTPQGFRDRRAGNVLVPWTMVESGRISPLGKGEVLVIFTLNADPDERMTYHLMSSSGRLDWPFFDGRRINIGTNALDLSPQDMLTAAKEFAPHIEIDMSRLV
jgi:hypothetical protein